MSFFNKILAKVGVGAAEIDTLLEKSSYVQGETVRGIIKVNGGQVDQDIDRIYIHLQTRYLRDLNKRTVTEHFTIAKFNVSGPIQLKSGEQLELPFNFELPLETPVTLYDQPVWLHTGLDIQTALDPTDQDAIEVHPHPYMQSFFEAVELLGCRFHTSICEYQPSYARGIDFAQEFEFLPGPTFAHHINELEFIFHLRPDGLDVRVALDRRSGGFLDLFENATDLNERHTLLSFSPTELAQQQDIVAKRIQDFIERYNK